MADLFKSAALLLMTPYCYEQYFLNFNFFHGECLKATISKALGFLIITGSLTVKVPQILKIVNSRSEKGLSLVGNILDFTAITSFFLYGYTKKFPFSAWGEGLFLAIQTAIIICLIFHYKKQPMSLVLFLATYSTLIFLFLFEIIPASVLWILQILNLPIVILGKGMQALTNYRNQSTGQLSAITSWMQFVGSVARVFTSVQETGDNIVILSFIVTSILNGTIVFQLLYYSKGEKKNKGKGKGKGKGKKSE